MSKRPQLIGLVDKPITEDNPVKFFYAENDRPTPLPTDYIDYKADQFQVRHLNREPRIKEHELLADHGSELLMRIMETELEVHLVINSHGGNVGTWGKYANALSQLKYEGATLNTHALQRAFGLAANIFADSDKQSVLSTTELIFEAGNFTPEQVKDIIVQAAESEGIILPPTVLEERVHHQLQLATQDWQRIKQFLLSNPGSIHREGLKKMLESMDAKGQRRLPITGEDLKLAGCFLTTYNSVRDMFRGFCEQTGIEFSSLPKSPISKTFTIAAIEEQIKAETGIDAAVRLERAPNGVHNARLTATNCNEIPKHEKKILDIINNVMFTGGFAAQSIQH